jgi:hypothetical protein
VYSYNFDDGTLQGWTTSGTANWGVTMSSSHSGSYSVTDSPGGDYVNSAITYLTSPVLNLTGTSNPVLAFYHKYDLENGFDFGYVQISTNGGASFNTVKTYTGTQSSFAQEAFDLTPYQSSSTVVIRFHMTSDSIVISDGWYIDDIEILD